MEGLKTSSSRASSGGMELVMLDERSKSPFWESRMSCVRISSELQDSQPKSCSRVGGMHSFTIALKSSRSRFCKCGCVEGCTPHRLSTVLSSVAGQRDSSCS